MAEQKLSNGYLEITVREHGAELISLKKTETGTEYLWNADPEFWGRTSPVLFPFVGGITERKYRHAGQEYPMGQHGFARDKEFTAMSGPEGELWYSLSADEETRKVYPFDFVLECGYSLNKNRVKVMWRVKNEGRDTMYFSIGGHPAFFCPPENKGKRSECSIGFDTEKPLTVTKISDRGLALPDTETVPLENGILRIGEHLFDQDALVIENDQVHEVSLIDESGKTYAAVCFDAPLFGVWSPAGKNAPFVCIEPWFGRCDGEGFSGTLAEREWGNSLEPGNVWERFYEIEV